MSARDRTTGRGDGEEGRTREEQDRAAEGGNDHRANSVEPTVPEAGAAQDELVDKASEESFPASDPPFYWQRESNEEQRRASDEQEGDSDDDANKKPVSAPTRAGSNVPNAGRDPEEGRTE